MGENYNRLCLDIKVLLSSVAAPNICPKEGHAGEYVMGRGWRSKTAKVGHPILPSFMNYPLVQRVAQRGKYSAYLSLQLPFSLEKVRFLRCRPIL